MITDAQILAIALLLMRIVAIVLISFVVQRQFVYLFTTQTKFRAVRATIMILTGVILLGQILPTVLDSIVSSGALYPGRNPNPTSYNIAYSLNSAITNLLMSGLLFFLYYRKSND